jgi:hypothetical protein
VAGTGPLRATGADQVLPSSCELVYMTRPVPWPGGSDEATSSQAACTPPAASTASALPKLYFMRDGKLEFEITRGADQPAAIADGGTKNAAIKIASGSNGMAASCGRGLEH